MTVTKTIAGDYITSTKCLTAHEVRVGGGLTVSAPHVFKSDDPTATGLDSLVQNKDVRMVPKQLVFTVPSHPPTDDVVTADGTSLGVPKVAKQGEPNIPTSYTLDGDILVHGVGLKSDGAKLMVTTDGSGSSSLDAQDLSWLGGGGNASATGTDLVTLTVDSTDYVLVSKSKLHSLLQEVSTAISTGSTTNLDTAIGTIA